MKVIKHGSLWCENNRTFKRECPSCHCVFTYTVKEKSYENTITCPECDDTLNHVFSVEINPEEEVKYD